MLYSRNPPPVFQIGGFKPQALEDTTKRHICVPQADYEVWTLDQLTAQTFGTLRDMYVTNNDVFMNNTDVSFPLPSSLLKCARENVQVPTIMPL